jgi:hypothetical protein
LRRAKSFYLDIERTAFLRTADRRLDELLLADRGELGARVDILLPAPPPNVQAQYALEVIAFGDPLIHHFRERGPALRVQSCFTGVAELVDDLDAMLFRPSSNLILLDRDRVLLSILGRVPLVRNRSHQSRRICIRQANLPPRNHL